MLSERMKMLTERVDELLLEEGIEIIRAISPVKSMDEVKVGHVLHIPWVSRYQHGATIVVTKVNRKSFKGIELHRSYQPSTLWSVRKDQVLEFVWHKEDKKQWTTIPAEDYYNE